MEVILLERIEKLGQMGQVVNVKPGFARNYLLPLRKALRATKQNMAEFEKRRAQLEADNLKRRGEAEHVASKMDGLAIVLIRTASETGHLYGSASARDVAESVTKAGFTIERRQVLLDQPIKMIGVFETKVALHPEVAVSVKVNVARSPEEAEIQARTGRANIVVEGRGGEPEGVEAALAAAAAVPAEPAPEPEAAPAAEEKPAKAAKKAKDKDEAKEDARDMPKAEKKSKKK